MTGRYQRGVSRARALARAINRDVLSGAAIHARFATGPLADGNGHPVLEARLRRGGELEVLLAHSGEWQAITSGDWIDGLRGPIT